MPQHACRWLTRIQEFRRASRTFVANGASYSFQFENIALSATLEQRMSERRTPRIAPRHIDDVRRACDAIRAWVLAANGNDVELLADALQLKVWATPAGAEVEGVIPDSASMGSDAHVRDLVMTTRT